jgi:hypothetical protein
MTTSILEAQTALVTGLAPVYNTPVATDGDSWANNGKILMLVRNAGAELTVTIDTPGVIDTDLAVGQRTITVPAISGAAGTETIYVAGPFPTAVYNQTSGRVKAVFSRVTDVTFALVKLAV